MTEVPAQSPQTRDAAKSRGGHGHRRGVRRSLSADGFIRHDGSDWPCSVCNCSLADAFVQIPVELALAEGALVDLNLTLRSANRSKTYHIRAEVMRLQPGGAALRFEHLDSWAYTAMVDTLYTN